MKRLPQEKDAPKIAGIMAIKFHGLTIEQIAKRLEKELQPIYSEAAKIAVETCAEHLRSKLDVPYAGTASISKVKKIRSGKTWRWGKPYGKSAKGTEYPRRRTGSLQASVGTTPVVMHDNVYSASFGVVKDVLKGKVKRNVRKARKEHSTLFKKHLKSGGKASEFDRKSRDTPPTLYAKYLEGGTKHKDGTKKMAPRRLTMSAWLEVKYSDKLKKALEAIKGKGSRIYGAGPKPKLRSQ